MNVKPPPPAPSSAPWKGRREGGSRPLGGLSNSNSPSAAAAMATIGGGNLREAVKLPAGEDPNEWLAIHVADFFKQVSMLYGTIRDACTPETCPTMKAGRYEYAWTDPVTKRAIACSAPKYVDYLFTSVQEQLDDERIFPSIIGRPFPSDFKSKCESIFRRIFRVYAHVYYAHAATIAQLGAMAHLNTSFKHFMLFIKQHDLIDSTHLAPLRHIIENLAPEH